MSSGERNKVVGRYGERVAAQRLVEQGMVVLDRNWRCGDGEIDLVLRDGETLVVCEVKTRSSASYGHPVEAVQEVKAARLRQLALRWIDSRGVHPEHLRIDVVGVLLTARGAAEVEHVRGIG